MFLRLDNVYDFMGRHVVCQADLENGQVAMIKGQAEGQIVQKSGVDLDGQAFEVVAPADELGALYVLIASDNHRYEDAVAYNIGDCPTTKAGELVRAYIVGQGQTATLEQDVFVSGSSLKVGDYVVADATYKLKKATGSEKVVVGKVVAKVRLYGKDMIKVMFA